MSKGLYYVKWINDLMDEGLSPMNAIMYIHEQHGIEIEKLSDIVRSNQKLKAALAQEATTLRMLKE